MVQEVQEYRNIKGIFVITDEPKLERLDNEVARKELPNKRKVKERNNVRTERFYVIHSGLEFSGLVREVEK